MTIYILSLYCFFIAYISAKFLSIRGTLDIPNERSSHTIPTPRGGGIGFVLAFLSSIWFLHPSLSLAMPLTIGGSLIAGISYLDDHYSLSIKIRLIVQFVVAIFFMFFLHLNYWLIIPTLFATVWLINLYNFMDGIDGLAGSQAVFVSLCATGMLFYQGDIVTAQMLLLLSISASAFLVLNWPPARIFMGDVGSCTLGFIFAVFAFQTLTIFFWFIIMAVFLCDTTFTLMRRIWEKEIWYHAHCSHVYQRLVQRGYTHQQVIIRIFLFNLCVLLPLAIFSLRQPYLATGIALVLCSSLWYRLSK